MLVNVLVGLITGVVLLIGVWGYGQIGRYRELWKAKSREYDKVLHQTLRVQQENKLLSAHLENMQAIYTNFMAKPVMAMMSTEQITELSKLVVVGLSKQPKSLMN